MKAVAVLMEILATITLLRRKPMPAINATRFPSRKRMAEDSASREKADYERLKAKYDPPANAQAGK